MLRVACAITCFVAVSGAATSLHAQEPPCPRGRTCVSVQDPETGGTRRIAVSEEPWTEPLEQRTRTGTRLRWSLVLPGIALVVGGLAVNALTAGSTILAGSHWRPDYDARDYFASSVLPLVGPWVSVAFQVGNNDASLAMHIVWGVVHTAGWVLCIAGTVLRDPYTVIEYARAVPLRVAVLPWAAPSGAGVILGAAGF